MVEQEPNQLATRFERYATACSAMAMASTALLGMTGPGTTPPAQADIYYFVADYTADGSSISLGYLGIDFEGSDGISPVVVYSSGKTSYPYELILFHYDSPGFTTTTTIQEGATAGASTTYVLWSASYGGGPSYGAVRVGAGVTVDSSLAGGSLYPTSYWSKMPDILTKLFAPKYLYFHYPYLSFGPYGTFTTDPASSYYDPEVYDNFLAVKFFHDTKSSFYYGWVQIYLLDTPYGPEPTVHIVAWGLPSDDVITGVVPEPGSSALALLALGAFGLPAWRRHRRERRDQLLESRKEQADLA